MPKTWPKQGHPFTLGGSDIATVFGLNPWQTPLELFMEKRDLLAPNEEENVKQKQIGRLFRARGGRRVCYGNRQRNH